MKQNSKTVTVIDYYIQLRIVWDELENHSDSPVLSNVTDEMQAYLDAIIMKQKEEARPFKN